MLGPHGNPTEQPSTAKQQETESRMPLIHGQAVVVEPPATNPVEEPAAWPPKDELRPRPKQKSRSSKEKKTVEAELAELLRGLDATPARFVPATRSRSADLVAESPLLGALGGLDSTSNDRWWTLLHSAADTDGGCDSAVGSLLGLAIGDALGAPLEFCFVDSNLPDCETGTKPKNMRRVVEAIGDATGFGRGPRRPHLEEGLHAGRFRYVAETNRFKLLPGQWTDDCSMALCLADSLLVHSGYHGGDVRLRWHMWWNHGYCNAFRHQGGGKRQTSVGLGGNVSESLADVQRCVRRAARGVKPIDCVPAIYEAGGEDAGNGSIMRLAPVPIGYHGSTDEMLDVAARQSLATHPSDEAAGCCRFLSFLIGRAICSHKAGQGLDITQDHRRFIIWQIDDFLLIDKSANGVGCGVKRLHELLRSAPPSNKEQHWDWRRPQLAIKEALDARGRSYNGYPVDPCYFGSYCMDGLAMALWAVWHATDFESCLRRAVNLLGDADTVAAIAGQIAGALFGLRGIASREFGNVCLENLRVWDPCAEIGLRACLLYHFGPGQRDCVSV
eukprot:TRINITY_DN10900_c0_g1_i1.p1 TRINITY_DN10900_c0_g1~~TRINITY_DN10900_c0_g1_i1.p1  ORF type:complete len:558 (+),score=94.72 TRINITY_DN10900_c0_g1_i1:58-1731(+)